MSALLSATGGNLLGLTFATAGTPWYAVVPGRAGLFARLQSLEINNGATDNGIYLMRPFVSVLTSVPVVQTAQAASDTTLILDRDPSPSGNTIAAGDQVVYLASDGTYRRVTVSAWTPATYTLTVSALPAAVAAGSFAWNFGVFSDTEPTTSLPFPLLSTPVSVVTPKDFAIGFGPFVTGAPFMLYSPNATNRTDLNHAEYAYTGV